MLSGVVEFPTFPVGPT